MGNNHGVCLNGTCECDKAFTGDDCGLKRCAFDCSGHGNCSKDGTCKCAPGWKGVGCQNKTCINECSKRGKCRLGKCYCFQGFAGNDCSVKSCPGHGPAGKCSGNGKCNNATGLCTCGPMHKALDCSVKRDCPMDCSGHGACVEHKCECLGNFTGHDCSKPPGTPKTEPKVKKIADGLEGPLMDFGAPPGWEVYLDTVQNKHFYAHKKTGRKQWTYPTVEEEEETEKQPEPASTPESKPKNDTKPKAPLSPGDVCNPICSDNGVCVAQPGAEFGKCECKKGWGGA